MITQVKFHELALPRTLCLVLVLLLWGEISPVFEFSAIALLLLSVAVAARKVPTPPKWVVPSLALVSGAVIYGSAGTLIGREPSAALLAVLSGLKALESRESADERTLSLIGLFLTVVVSLFRPDLWMAIFAVFCCMGFLWLLFRRAQAALSQRGAWNWVLRLSLQAAPLTALLFVTVPRLQHNGLWGQRASTQSGFREDLNPALVESIEPDPTPVFRVEWPEDRPPKRPIFWRGAVLSEHRAFSWRSAPVDRGDVDEEAKGEVFAVQSPGEKRVEWILEPQNGRWTFAPEGTRAARESLSFRRLEVDRRSGVWRVQGTPGKRIRLEAIFGERLFHEKDDKAWLSSPRANGRTMDWVRKAVEGVQGRRDRMSAIMQTFSHQGFVYTRSPGRIDSLDEFLQLKKGFCEHYSSATAALGRLAGVPTRVVVGFLGGDFNPFGRFLLVTKADAHAWTEFLDDDGIWRTADATSYVPPLDPVRDRRAPVVDPEKASFLERMKWNLDAINYRVAGFLMAFDLEAQAALWDRLTALGFAAPLLILVALVAFVFVFLRGQGGLFFWKNREALAIKRYRRLIEKNQGQGRAVSFQRGPLENLKGLLGDSLSENARIEEIVQAYIRYRYR